MASGNNVQAAFRRLRGLGLTPAQAAGAVGALTGESGPNLDPNARNPTSGAIGVGQWLGARAHGVRPGDFQGQLNHLVGELQGSERGALAALKAAKGPREAAAIFTRSFERPSAGEIASSLPARQAAAARILAQHGGDAGSASPSDAASRPGKLSITGTVTPAHEAPSRTAAVEAVLRRGASTGLQDFRTSRLAQADKLFRLGLATDTVPTQATQQITQTPGSAVSGTGSSAEQVVARVNVFDKANRAGKLPYKWGGGHGGKLDVLKSGAVPVDCSGLVSSALGINPRVASQFESWGRPGAHADSTIVVYAKSTHVLAKVKGRDGKWHFFGTSHANAGGGAGWIPASQVPAAYLRGFKVRSN